MLARIAVLLLLGLAVMAFGCSVADTPTPTSTLAPTSTPTPPPVRAEDMRVVDQRQVAFEGDGVQSLLWWSDDGKEFIITREPSRRVQIERMRGQWDKCGNDYVQASHVWRVHADGRREFLVESFDSPSVSPDGRYLLYTKGVRCDEEWRFSRSLALLDLQTLDSRVLIETTVPQLVWPRWLRSSSAIVLVAREDGIYSVETATGEVRKLNDVKLPATDLISFHPSPDGTRLAYYKGSFAAGYDLWRMNMDGSNDQQVAMGVWRSGAVWLPDSSGLVYFLPPRIMPGGSINNLHIVRFTSEGISKTVLELGGDVDEGVPSPPVWSTDGQVMAIARVRDTMTIGASSTAVYVLNSDGAGVSRLVTLPAVLGRVEWDSSGTVLFLPAQSAPGGATALWALALDEAAAKRLPSEPVSLYVRADPASVAPNRYVYLEPDNVSDELKLQASTGALAQEGMTLVRNRRELERAVGPETRAVVLNREGVGEVDPAWVRQQYEAGRPIWGVWVSGDELKDLLDAQAPMSLYKYTPGRSFLRGYLEKNPEGKPSYGGGEGTLQGDRLTLYRLMDEISSHGLSLRDIMNAPRRPGAPTSTPTPSPTPTYDLACPTSPQLSSFSVPLSDADAVRKAVLSGCYAAPGRDVRLQATKATITSTTWREFRPNLGDTAHSYPDDEPLAIVTLTGIEGYDYYQVVMSRRTGGIFHEALHPGPPPFLSGATPTPTTTFAPTRRPTPTPAASPMLPIWTIPTPTMTPTPIGYPISCQPGATTAPCGSGAVVGQPYSYRLYTHCGIHQAYFDGRWWVASPRLDDGNLNPPPGWGNPQDTGVMMLVQVDRARFTNASGLSADFRPAPPSYQPEGCY